MKTDFSRIGKFLGIGLVSVLLAFLLLNLATADESACTIEGCEEYAIEFCAAVGSEADCILNETMACIQESEDSNHNYCRAKNFNLNSQNNARKGDGIDPPGETKCEYVGIAESEPPSFMFCHEEEEWEYDED